MTGTPPDADGTATTTPGKAGGKGVRGARKGAGPDVALGGFFKRVTRQHSGVDLGAGADSDSGSDLDVRVQTQSNGAGAVKSKGGGASASDDERGGFTYLDSSGEGDDDADAECFEFDCDWDGDVDGEDNGDEEQENGDDGECSKDKNTDGHNKDVADCDNSKQASHRDHGDDNNAGNAPAQTVTETEEKAASSTAVKVKVEGSATAAANPNSCSVITSTAAALRSNSGSGLAPSSVSAAAGNIAPSLLPTSTSAAVVPATPAKRAQSGRVPVAHRDSDGDLTGAGELDADLAWQPPCFRPPTAAWADDRAVSASYFYTAALPTAAAPVAPVSLPQLQQQQHGLQAQAQAQTHPTHANAQLVPRSPAAPARTVAGGSPQQRNTAQGAPLLLTPGLTQGQPGHRGPAQTQASHREDGSTPAKAGSIYARHKRNIDQ